MHNRAAADVSNNRSVPNRLGSSDSPRAQSATPFDSGVRPADVDDRTSVSVSYRLDRSMTISIPPKADDEAHRGECEARDREELCEDGIVRSVQRQIAMHLRTSHAWRRRYRALAAQPAA